MCQARPGCRWCARRTRTRRSMASTPRWRGKCLACSACSLRRTCASVGPLPCTVPVASVAPMIVPPRPALAADAGAACRRSGRIRSGRDAHRRTRCGGGGERGLPHAARRGRCGSSIVADRAATMGRRRTAICRTASRRATPAAVAAAMRDAAHVSGAGAGQQPNRDLRDGNTGRDRTARCRWVPSDVLRRRRARAAIAACRQRVPRAAGADARVLPGRRWRLRREECAVSRMGHAAVGGAHSGPAGEVDRRAQRKTSSPPRKAATMLRAPGWRWTTRAASWHWTLPQLPISARIFRRAVQAVPPMRRPTPWAAAMSFRRSSWTCRGCSPTPCRSMPIAAPASPK